MYNVGNSRVAWLSRCRSALRNRFEIRLATLAIVLIVIVWLAFGAWAPAPALVAVLALALSAVIGSGAVLLIAAQRRELLLAQSLRCWQQVFEQSSRGLAIGCADARTLLQMNPAYARMHGYRVDELTG